MLRSLQSPEMRCTAPCSPPSGSGRKVQTYCASTVLTVSSRFIPVMISHEVNVGIAQMQGHTPCSPMETAMASQVDRRTFGQGCAGRRRFHHRSAPCCGVPGTKPWRGRDGDRFRVATNRHDRCAPHRRLAKGHRRQDYAADFRAVDMPGWPRQTAHAMLLKTSDATHIFEGLELAGLDRDLLPIRAVLAGDLARLRSPCPTSTPRSSVPAGKTPLYLGQPSRSDLERFTGSRPPGRRSSRVRLLRFGRRSCCGAAVRGGALRARRRPEGGC